MTKTKQEAVSIAKKVRVGTTFFNSYNNATAVMHVERSSTGKWKYLKLLSSTGTEWNVNRQSFIDRTMDGAYKTFGNLMGGKYMDEFEEFWTELTVGQNISILDNTKNKWYHYKIDAPPSKQWGQKYLQCLPYSKEEGKVKTYTKTYLNTKYNRDELRLTHTLSQKQQQIDENHEKSNVSKEKQRRNSRLANLLSSGKRQSPTKSRLVGNTAVYCREGRKINRAEIKQRIRPYLIS